jgi:hypothetical protein
LIRLATALIVMGCCLFAVVRGWSIVQFAEAQARIEANRASAEIMRPSIGTPGLTGPALEVMLATARPDGDDEARSDALTALLAEHPLSSVNWLSLAATRLANQNPLSEVQSAAMMSWLTGPNEGNFMWRRAMFGLLHWETLTSDAQRRTIADLSGAVLEHIASGEDISLARNVLSREPSEIRARIGDMLRLSGVDQPQLTKLGLPSDGG